MTITEEIWATPTPTGQTLAERVMRTPPLIRVMQQDNLDAFVKIWSERLKDALAGTDQAMEKKARTLLEFVAIKPPDGFALLLWGEFKLSALYNSELKRIYLIE